MNIYELSNRTSISLTMLRKLARLKVNFDNLESETSFVETLRFHLGRNQQMTVEQLLTVLDDPRLLDWLGAVSTRLETRARGQIAALGDVKASSAPREVTAEIYEAGKRDKRAALVIADWLKTVLPLEPVSHHWVAVRLLAPLNEFLRGQYAPMISFALLNVRQLPEFAGWWRAEGPKKRKVTKYSKPGARFYL